MRAVGDLGPAKQGLPDLLGEEGVADEVAARGREDHLALLRRSALDVAVHIDRLQVSMLNLPSVSPRTLNRLSLEERPGFAGALRTSGGLGGHLGAPHFQWISSALKK